MNSYSITDFDKISQAINGAPKTRNFFSLWKGEKAEIKDLFYKDKRQEFIDELKKFLNQETTETGIYTVKNGSSAKTAPFFTIQKGTPKPEDFKTISKMDDSPSIALVKENAELKAELAYLKIRFSELEAELAEQESDLAEQEEIKEEQKPNAWASLAESLLPLAGQMAAAIATKYFTPQTNGQPGTSEGTMAPGYAGPNAQSFTPPVQYRRPNYSGNVQSNDNSGPINGNHYFEANQEAE
jgi:hypothetical protein